MLFKMSHIAGSSKWSIQKTQLYTKLRPLSNDTYNELLHLSQFVSCTKQRAYYKGLSHKAKGEKNVLFLLATLPVKI